MVYQQYVSKEHVIVGKAVFKREKDRSACSNQFARTILKSACVNIENHCGDRI